MSSICGESIVDFDGQDSNAHDEKIFVSIRLRPLNDTELSKNDVSEWECIDNTTLLFKNTLHERTLQLTAYTFDRVFGYDSPTRQVYDESAKKIALSVLNGMNSTIFAYGQTSSGKTYTMSGITECTVADVYEYINMHPEREFILKFSAMEIYNEAVRDLLVLEGGPLRLLDDPERTVVDKLTEVMVTDCNHLRELLSICEAQRQNGETTLNEVSSRSHQILRLTVESQARGYHGAGSSSLLTASVSFVDLAGSERASQTLSAGTRLKEGCHINRSLLTLGTVIRKLSKGRNAHIPYRDSKLTRILQNSLGGNARTAIICTMSPAHTHLEQSRNTLLFASCAKQVSTNAQVNVVMSKKALVKQLQKELARLENELRKLSSVASTGGSSSALKEKELLIEKMDKEIKELTHQRDLAQSRVEDSLGWTSHAKILVDMHHHDKASWASEYAASEASDIIDPFRSDFLSGDTSPGLYFGPDPCQGWEKTASQENNKKNSFEDNCKEVKCIEIDFTKMKYPRSSNKEGYIAKRNNILSPRNGDRQVLVVRSPRSPGNKANAKRRTVSIASSPQKDDNVSSEQSPCSSDNVSSDASVKVPRSQSCAAILIMKSSSSEFLTEDENENTSQDKTDIQEKLTNVETVTKTGNLCREDSKSSDNSECLNEKDQIIMTEQKQEHNNEVIESKSVKQAEDELVRTHSCDQDMGVEKTPNKSEETPDVDDKTQSVSDWKAEFERQQKNIIELWDVCHIPLAHRTYFFLLFKGDPSDAVYMEVELRRLSFLKNTIHGVVKDDQLFTQPSRYIHFCC
ncbi:hypothetical protein CASFOL_017017 [Castilleja foliolosa]|uniref:Kinesin-like protein n=1 Tax=Castilleja foliolosa TaxID=1961234 RepID=A0ABD3D9W1_9LAMI